LSQKKLWSKEFVAIVSSNLFMAWAFFALLPTLPLYLIKTLKISASNVGTVMGAFAIAAIVIRPVSGYLIDHYHRWTILIISLVFMTVGYGVYPVIGTVAGMFLTRFMHGLTWGICTSSSSTMAVDIVPPSRLGAGIGIYALSMPVGMTIGPLFGLGLMRAGGPYLMFLAALGISLLSVVTALFAKTPIEPVPGKKFSFSNLFHTKALPISFCMFLVMTAYGSISIFVTIYAVQRGFSNVAQFFLCFAVSMVLSRFFSGKLYDQGNILLLFLAGHLLSAVGLLWLGYAKSPVHFLFAGTTCALGFGTLMPTSQAAVNSLVKPHERGSVNSTYLTSYDLGVGVASLTVGFLAEKMPIGEIYRYAVLPIILSAAIFVLKAIPHYHDHKPGGRLSP
jgi:MFS family permease